MPTFFERLKAATPTATFDPPATIQQITRVERALGTPFPQWLRELYLSCNGISGPNFQEPYLNILESPPKDEDESDYSLLGWNQFHRNLCDESRHGYEDGRLDQWEKLHARNFLLIGSTGATDQEWAIRLDGSTEILWYDVRNPGDYTVLGNDLVEVVINYERKDREIRNQIYRGRQNLRQDADPLPPSNDIELILDTLIEFHRGTKAIPMFAREATSPGWSVQRAISQRPHESGSLFILKRSSIEFQIATRDGNLPFILRTKVPHLEEPLQCLVKDLPEVLLCILSAMDLSRTSLPETAAARAQLKTHCQTIWRHRYGPPDPQLESIAQALFHRDDRRLQEENPLGG